MSSVKAKPVPPADDYVALVLLVDDQVFVGEAVRQALEDQPNLDFHFCCEPEEAMATAKQIKPTVILQDLIMPGVDGVNLVYEYRADPLTRDIPVIVLSTNEDPLTKSKAFRAGANDYLVKLPDPIELIARIRYHSKAYLNQIQRDEAYRALRQSQQELLEMNIELQRLNNVDGLTGLSNRRYADDYLTKEWKRALREKTPLSLLMIDVDEFKPYNDTFGHLAGDEVLKKIAATTKKCFARPADIIARFGGEEFIVILPNTEHNGANFVAEKIRRNVELLEITTSNANSKHVTVSVGTATIIPPRDELPTSLIKQADMALYQAKREGRNRVVSASGAVIPTQK